MHCIKSALILIIGNTYVGQWWWVDAGSSKPWKKAKSFVLQYIKDYFFFYLCLHCSLHSLTEVELMKTAEKETSEIKNENIDVKYKSKMK